MPEAVTFRNATILGIGLIGGSFGLALRKYAPEIRVAGWDREKAVRAALARGAVQEAYSGEMAPALAGADLIYIALPIGVTMDLLPEIVRHAPAGALLTDACSTKMRLCQHAAEVLAADPGGRLLLLPGHPMAGKELSGVAHAGADLFRDATYALIVDRFAVTKTVERFAVNKTDEGELRNEPRALAFVALLQRLGARPLWLGAQKHDWAVGMVSHLPQLTAVALAAFIYGQLDENGLPITLAGPGLRDSLRLAGSPYATWRDILLTNRDFLSAALMVLARHIEDLRDKLSTRELEADFDAANELYKLLRDLK